jgi:predicted Zn-dependent protease
MKTSLLAVVLAFSVPSLMPAQFGGILNRAKEKMDKARPVTDRAQRAADTFQDWNTSEEQEIGGATAAKMIAIFGLVDNANTTRYVNLVGQAVAQFSSRQMPYRFGILDTEIVGAYALPGGYIFITRQALAGMKNEAELAGALGHEIVHVAERHLERAIRSKKTSAWAVEEGKARATAGSQYLNNKANAFVTDLFNTSLSRDKEEAADEQGTALAIKAGYAASGLRDFLKTLEQANSKPENKQAFGQLLSTHPPFEDRVARLNPIVDRAAGNGKTLEARFEANVK